MSPQCKSPDYHKNQNLCNYILKVHNYLLGFAHPARSNLPGLERVFNRFLQWLLVNLHLKTENFFSMFRVLLLIYCRSFMLSLSHHCDSTWFPAVHSFYIFLSSSLSLFNFLISFLCFIRLFSWKLLKESLFNSAG